MHLSAKNMLLGFALLLAAFPLCANENSGNPAVASAPHAYIKCPGIANVPMTSDAAQALPLAQVATLACGEAVSVLADNEGYTALVRTEDGKQGYIARMYLATATPPSVPKPKAAAAIPIANAKPQNGVVRWAAGVPGCDAFQSHGRMIESATAGGITVQVSLQDTGWKLLATVAVSNQSGKNVYVMPALMTLDELTPHLRNLPEQNAAKLARYQASHQLFRDQANAQPSHSAVFASNASSVSMFNVDYRPAPQDITPSTSEATSAQAMALKDIHLASGQKTAGVLWFAREAGAHELSMRLSVGDIVFDFPFSFEQKK
jgi:hypothetical protein